jgi:hypothetical protein
MMDKLKNAIYNIESMFIGTKNDLGITLISFKTLIESIEREPYSIEQQEILQNIYQLNALIKIVQKDLPKCITEDYK